MKLSCLIVATSVANCVYQCPSVSISVGLSPSVANCVQQCGYGVGHLSLHSSWIRNESQIRDIINLEGFEIRDIINLEGFAPHFEPQRSVRRSTV